MEELEAKCLECDNWDNEDGCCAIYPFDFIVGCVDYEPRKQEEGADNE